LSPGKGAFSARLPLGRACQVDGDKSPAQSGDKSPHSKAAVRQALLELGGIIST
jgi:hypothetical protein